MRLASEEAYRNACQTSKMKLFERTVIGFQPKTIFTNEFHCKYLTGFSICLCASLWLQINKVKALIKSLSLVAEGRFQDA